MHSHGQRDSSVNSSQGTQQRRRDLNLTEPVNTMATAAGSPTTPHWDNRTRDFGQLQHLRQTSPLSRELTSPDRPHSMADSQSSSLRPLLATTNTHTRSSSFFSFLKSNDNTPSTMPSRRIEPSSQQSQLDEHGRLVPGVPDKRQPPLPPPAPLDRSPSIPTSVPPQQLHPEIRSVVSLTHVHAHKVYMSGPLIRRIERLPDGHQPIKDEDWRDVWAQLGGTTLSIWDMKEIEEASKEGKEVPPTYINVTDAVSLFPNPRLECYLILSISSCKSSEPSRYLRPRESLRRDITTS